MESPGLKQSPNRGWDRRNRRLFDEWRFRLPVFSDGAWAKRVPCPGPVSGWRSARNAFSYGIKNAH